VTPPRLPDHRARLAEILVENRLDALVLCGLPNIRYLTGFTGSNALLLITRQDAVFYTDGRYGTQSAQEVRDARIIVRRSGSILRSLIGSIKLRRLRRLGFESNRAGYEFYQTLRSSLPGIGLKGLSGVIENLRVVKSPEEVAAIRRSVRLNSAVFEASIRRIRPGHSEAGVAAAIEHRMRRRGGEKAAFETIVAAGVRSALPHARPTSNPLKTNELIIVDQGVILDGYASDMTRTIALGSLGSRARRVYYAVLEAQQAAIAVVRAGVQARDVDREARRVLDHYGLEKAFVHSTGHGVGLEIHERPRLGRGERTKLEAGMVITIEPGAYLEGFGGVRIEDMVLVTDRGCDVLTPTPKDLWVL